MGPQLKVAVLADWWWPETVGGAEQSARGAALELARFAQVAVFVPGAVEATYQDGPITVHKVRRPFARRRHADSAARRGIEFLSAWLLPVVASRLKRSLTEYGPDVVVATNISRTGPWLIRWAAKAGVGFVRTFHDLSDTCWRRSRLKNLENCVSICGECTLKTRLMRNAVPANGVSVCVSQFVRGELISAGLATQERSVVGYPLTVSDTAPMPGRSPGTGGVVIGFIGRLSPVKGLESAILTAAAYRKLVHGDVSMVLAGEGQPAYRRELERLAADAGLSVDFIGQTDVARFCELVDVVLIPSKWMEPFGRVPVEIGRRRPMLLSPTGGLPEAAQISGGRFAFADFSDHEGAARTLARLLSGAEPTPAPQASPAKPLSLNEAVTAAVHRVLAERGRATTTGSP